MSCTKCRSRFIMYIDTSRFAQHSFFSSHVQLAWQLGWYRLGQREPCCLVLLHVKMPVGTSAPARIYLHKFCHRIGRDSRNIMLICEAVHRMIISCNPKTHDKLPVPAMYSKMRGKLVMSSPEPGGLVSPITNDANPASKQFLYGAVHEHVM